MKQYFEDVASRKLKKWGSRFEISLKPLLLTTELITCFTS